MKAKDNNTPVEDVDPFAQAIFDKCKLAMEGDRGWLQYLLVFTEAYPIVSDIVEKGYVKAGYGSSKLSLLKLTRAYGKRCGKDGIIINGIAPGATFTPMIASYAKSPEDPYERLAIGRFIRAEEIAELAAYLMSDMGEIICGHTVVADGGDSCAI